MKSATGTATETFPADVDRDIKAMVDTPGMRSAKRIANLQREVEVAWRLMVEEADEQTAMEAVINAIIREAKGRADEAGDWNRQELFARVEVLERAAEALGELQ
jgi:hypothetical protein